MRRRIKIIKEYPTNSSPLSPMRNIKVVITPFLELRVVRWIIRIARFLQTLVKVDSIFFGEVVRGEICSTSKPPQSVPLPIVHFEIMIVKVNGWYHQIDWMSHAAYTHSILPWNGRSSQGWYQCSCCVGGVWWLALLTGGDIWRSA